jgi:uncharacterized membrane protein
MRLARRGGDPSDAAALDVRPPGFDYNPSSWGQRVPICILAAVAFLIATYMALYQWRLLPHAWDPIFGDQTRRVLDSEASETMRRWMKIPDAALGAIAYLGDALFGLAGSTERWRRRPWIVILFGIDVIPLGVVSAVLVVMQGTVVGSWCFLCLVTALISLILVAFAWDEVWATLQYLRGVWRRTHDRRVLWRVFWGGAAPESAATLADERGAEDVAARR